MKQSIRWRWARSGAVFGLLVALSDLAEWRGPVYLPWQGGGIISNIMMMVVSILLGMMLFTVAAAVCRLLTKDF